MADLQIEMVDMSLIRAFESWAVQRELRGKGVADTASKIMRFWVEAALESIPSGDRFKVERYLKQQVTAYSRLSAAAKRGPVIGNSKAALKRRERSHQLRGTLAARIVGALNIYGARGKKFEAFYADVNKWLQRRVFSVNLHRAGMLPARRALRLRDRKGNMPRLQTAPGQYTERITDDVVTILVENWAQSRGGDGIVALAGNAFAAGLPAVERRIVDYVLGGMTDAARRVGLMVNGDVPTA